MNEDKRLRRMLIYISYFTLILTSAFIVYLSYLSIWPINILRLHEFRMVTKEVKRGELFSYYMRFEKLQNYKSVTRFYLVDGVIFRLAEEGVQKKANSYAIISSRMTPPTINPGMYRLRIEIDYKILPWRTISYEWETDTFAIR